MVARTLSCRRPALKRVPLKRKCNETAAATEIAASAAPSVERSACVNAYERAKRLFHRSASVRIVGRTLERAAIERFWKTACESTADTCRNLYVCGNPGTGKTALLDEMLPELASTHAERKYKVIRVNCMMHKNPIDALRALHQELDANIAQEPASVHKPQSKKRTKTANGDESILDKIRMLLQKIPAGQTFVLLLDEIDHLLDTAATECTLGDIYSLSRPLTNLIIIGIANALDLTIRSLHREDATTIVTNIAFGAYSAEDITRILTARMQLVNTLEDHPTLGAGQENRSPAPNTASACIISPAAIEMCARKASLVGDLRKALDIMRDAIGVAQKASSQLDGRSVPVGLPHVLAAMESILETSGTLTMSSRNAGRIGQLNLHQKLALGALRRLLIDSPDMRPSVTVLFERYVALIRQVRVVEAVVRSDFADLLANAEAMGVLSLVQPAAGRHFKSPKLGAVSLSAGKFDSRVHLCIPLEDVTAALHSTNLPALV